MIRRKTRSSLAVVTVLGMLLALLPLTAASAQVVSSDLIISGVVDGPLSGGVPKAIEVYVVNDVADLSQYGLGSANNGGGSDGQEFTFPAESASAGDYLCVASESAGFDTFFGFGPDYTSSAASINGDDAIELFKDAAVVDVFGDINTDGNGEPWEYLDGWAARVAGSGPDGSTFAIANWSFSGANALDGETSNGTAATPFPIGCDGPPPPPPAPDVDTAIYDIQYTPGPGGDSPLVGLTVVTEGVATAVFYNGAFIQDGQGPWSGLWLFGPSVTPEVGDLVRVQGEVSEYFGMTQIGGGTTWIVGADSVPEPEVLATGDIPQEMWEAVFVRAENALVDNPSLGFGEWSIDDGSGSARVADKGSYSYVPYAGDLVGYLQGPLDYSFSNFKIQPRDDDDVFVDLSACGDRFTPIYAIQGNGW
ncbi:MAG: nuclease, partial [Acidimicrobiia bacterium]|nr:nuclease [Acidimicrobiia bacterium]